ncbi:MAG: carboxylesterase family protein, partial [Alphaproteobacteria bacterium]|nr:carboxylesterase family protein [Alphaproteobacteria bacterium]
MTRREAVRPTAQSGQIVARLGATAAIILVFWHAVITGAGASTLVQTANGWVQGKTLSSVDQWLGIRYAAPPTGAGRWAPPKPPEYYGTRQDPYDATQFGSPCPQNISQFGNSIPLPIPPN